MVPMVYKTTDEDGEEERQLRGFKMSCCLFKASQTEGDDLPEPEPREWSKVRALEKLAITKVPFEMLESNTQGYSYDRKLSVFPVAAFPMKTWLHEAAHIVAGHTSNNINIIEYLQHRGLHELEAEGSAYILMNELGIAEPDELAESRTYIRHWIGDREVPEANIRRIFTTADSILRAGRLATSC
jgi:hypothetical protein